MARCEQGYLCEVCGDEVEEIADSDLYLRYIIGEIDAASLLSAPERHIRCNPVQAQFIVDPEFEPVSSTDRSRSDNLDQDDVRRREELVTRGWRRLQELKQLGISVSEYPLPEVLSRRRKTEPRKAGSAVR